MIELDVAQGSPEWHLARAGIPTGSEIHRILTPKRQEYSVAGARTYRCELLAEWMLGEAHENGPSPWMDRGREMEGDAAFWYSLKTGEDLDACGFLLRDDRRFGGSPDAVIRDTRGMMVYGLEIKVPAAKEVVAHLLGERDVKHLAQCQAYMYLTNTYWWDLLIWNPQIPPMLTRIKRDEAYIKKLDAALDRFLAYVGEGKDALIAKGISPNGGRQ